MLYAQKFNRRLSITNLYWKIYWTHKVNSLFQIFFPYARPKHQTLWPFRHLFKMSKYSITLINLFMVLLKKKWKKVLIEDTPRLKNLNSTDKIVRSNVVIGVWTPVPPFMCVSLNNYLLFRPFTNKKKMILIERLLEVWRQTRKQFINHNKRLNNWFQIL